MFNLRIKSATESEETSTDLIVPGDTITVKVIKHVKQIKNDSEYTLEIMYNEKMVKYYIMSFNSLLEV